MASVPAIRDEYSRALEEAAAALAVLGGSSEDVVPWAEFLIHLDFCSDVFILRTRLPDNLITFRANYSRLVAGWLLVCTVRHPFKSAVILMVLAAWFHALLVRRGVVHLQAPAAFPSLAGRHVTLMGSQLLLALGVASVLVLYCFGCLWHTCGLLLFSLCLVSLHAALRRPRNPGNSLELAAELRYRVLRALRGKHVDSEEMESGSTTDEPQPPVRDAEMAKRVEQIRQKYRPPTSKQNFD
ncbi:hypothetical protein AB1Y20_009888 [Prymnesium parvum]|uniref:PRA1 family protein n=1 Tax=Prymnesium parvum TaxID=97485 RepID=A0AB34K3D0_PRYPA